MRLRLFVFALLAAASFSAAAGSVDVNLSNDTIEGKFYGNAGAADWTVGALYNRDTRDRALNAGLLATGDRKSTRLNSSHSQISYAVFCLKKKEHRAAVIVRTHSISLVSNQWRSPRRS